jgi:hypothetical protein
MPDCAICQKPLTAPELRLNRAWHFDCEVCEICGDRDGIENNSTRIEKCLTDGAPISHVTCLKTKLFADFKNNVLPITMAHIQALNEEICGFFPAINPETADVTLLYNVLVKIQELATNVSTCLSATKDKLLIREARTFDHEQRQKAATRKAEQFESEKERLAAQAKTEMFKAERENPALRHRRKAIEGFMAIGMSEEQAKAMVDKQQGKEPIQ